MVAVQLAFPVIEVQNETVSGVEEGSLSQDLCEAAYQLAQDLSKLDLIERMIESPGGVSKETMRLYWLATEINNGEIFETRGGWRRRSSKYPEGG